MSCGDLRSVTPSLLQEVLYGKWTQWGGMPPPSSVVQERLSLVPADVLQTTPPQVSLGVSSLPGAPVGVFAAEIIQEGTEMGPYPGRALRLDDSKIDEDNAWELFSCRGQAEGVVLSAADRSSWVTYIQCARNEQEQNLATFQAGSAIYYRAIKKIELDEELLVWYGPHVPQCLGVPDVGSSGKSRESTESAREDRVPSTGRMKCVVCRRGFNSRSNLRSHMRVHTLERPFNCHVCGRRFSQSSTLRNHIRLHTGEKPYKCYVCSSAYSQLAGLRAHQRSARHRPTSSSTGVILSLSDGNNSSRALAESDTSSREENTEAR